MKEVKVSDIMTRKVITCPHTSSFFDAVLLMSEKRISSIVISKVGTPVGIITERDVVRKMAEKDAKLDASVKSIMSSPVKTISHDATLAQAGDMLLKYNIRRLIVKDKEMCVGIVTENDITKGALLEEKLLKDENKSFRERLSTILTTFPDGIDIVDENRNIIYMNERFLKLFGNSSIGKKCYEVYKDDKKPCLSCPLKKAIKLGKTNSIIVPGIVGNRVFDISHTGMMFEGRKVIMEIFRDITEQSKNLELLKQSEEKYKFLVDGMQELAIILDKVGRIQYANRFAFKTLGYNQRETIGKSILNFLEKDSVKKALYTIAQEFLGKHQSSFEINVKNKKGDIKTLKIAEASNPVYKDGKMIGILVNAVDITEQKKAEITLKNKESFLEKQNALLIKFSKIELGNSENFDSLFRFAVKEISDLIGVEQTGIWIFDKEDTILVEKICYTRSKKQFSSGERLLVKDYPNYFMALSKERAIVAHDALRDRRTKEFGKDYFRKLGIVSLLDSGIKVGKKVMGVLCLEHTGYKKRWSVEEQNFLSSISDFLSMTIELNIIKKKEIELKKSKEFSEKIIETAPYLIVGLDINANITLFNKEAEKITGYLKEGVLGKNWFKVFISKKDHKKITEVFTDLVKNNKIENAENNITLKNREQRLIFWANNILRDENKNNIGTISIGTDITEQKKAELKLKESEEKYKRIVDHLKDAMYIHDFHGNIIDVNNIACNMLGYKREELIGSNLAKIDSEDNKKKIVERMDCLIKNGYLLFTGEHIKKDGSHIFVEVSAVLISKEGNGLAQSFTRDISERKKQEYEKEVLNQELSKKVEELERFQKITIDRELKMIELKNKIKDIEEKTKEEAKK